MPRIFISYRRRGSYLVSQYIANKLQAVYGNENVFFDIESIESGKPFETEILSSINCSDVMLVMVDPQWSTITDTAGRKRLHDPKDFVHKEVKAGLKRADTTEMRVIPVLIDTDGFPPDIPVELASITGLDAIFIRSDDKFLAMSSDALVKEVKKVIPPESKVPERRIGCTASAAIAAVSSAIIFFVTIAGFGFQIFSDDQISQFRNFAGIMTAVPDEPTVIPITDTYLSDIQVEEGNSTIERNAIRVPLDDVANDPQALQIAPSAFGTAAWGYSAADRRLFALNIATGAPLNITDTGYLDLAAFDEALPASLHYDGHWLLVGDNRNHRLLAFDPFTLELVAEYDFGESGEPTQITQTGNVLWVSLRDADQVVGLTVDHETTTFSTHCNAPLTVGDSPYHLSAHGNAAIRVAYGRGENTAIRRISVNGCVLDQPIMTGETVTGLATFADTVYVSYGNTLAIVENDTLQTVYQADNQTLNHITTDNQYLWLATDTGLLAFNPLTTTIDRPITLTTPVLNTFSYGTQLWSVLDDGQILRYSIPIMTVTDAIGFLAHNQRMWIATQDGVLCPLDESLPCLELMLETPVSLITGSTLDNRLWLVDTEGNLIEADLTTGNIRQLQSLAFMPIMMELDTDGRLWLSDGIVFLAIYDLQTADLINTTNYDFIPTTITHDSATTWIGIPFPDRISAVMLDGNTIIESPLSANTEELSLLTASSRYLYAIEAGTIAVINTQSGDIINRYGISSNISQAIVTGNTLYTLGTDGAIYQQTVD